MTEHISRIASPGARATPPTLANSAGNACELGDETAGGKIFATCGHEITSEWLRTSGPVIRRSQSREGRKCLSYEIVCPACRAQLSEVELFSDEESATNWLHGSRGARATPGDGAPRKVDDEVAWVVVSGRPGLKYLTGKITPRWSDNHADAIRFARKQDAKRMIELMREILRSHGLFLPHDIRAEEHIWDAARAAPTVGLDSGAALDDDQGETT